LQIEAQPVVTAPSPYETSVSALLAPNPPDAESYAESNNPAELGTSTSISGERVMAGISISIDDWLKSVY
jgi:hypothetical protein